MKCQVLISLKTNKVNFRISPASSLLSALKVRSYITALPYSNNLVACFLTTRYRFFFPEPFTPQVLQQISIVHEIIAGD